MSRFLLSLAFVPLPALAQTVAGVPAEDWLAMSDAEFAETFSDIALSGDIELRSAVAWMLWARLSQPRTYEGATIAEWETWPSNADTFEPDAPPFDPATKVRAAPETGVTKAEQARGAFHTLPTEGGEERARNMLSYGYIREHTLYTKAGIGAYLAAGNAVDVPIGSIEVKADWQTGAVEGAYRWTPDPSDPATTFSLRGLHIMAKMALTPADPFTSETPSWFWTTFELNSNEGLENVRSFITYPDTWPAEEAAALLAAAGLEDGPFANYSPNGTQIRFADERNPSIVLGNSLMEDFAGLPLPPALGAAFDPATMDPLPPSQWTGFNSSCHTCHVTAAYQPEKDSFFDFLAQVGTGTLVPHMLDGYAAMDFIWSIPFNAK